MRKLLIFLVCVPLGFLLGTVGAFVHADRIKFGQHTIAYGVLLAVAFIAVSQLWVTRAFQSRIAAVAIGIGWILATAVLGADRSVNEAIILDSWWSKIYVPGMAVVIGIICALPPLRGLPDLEGLPEPFTEVMERQDSQTKSESD